MGAWTRIAARNLIKNKRRSLFTILAVAIGFAAVNVFGGFTEYIFRNLKESFIFAQGNGHLTVFKRGFLSEGKLDPLKFVLTESEADRIEKICGNDPAVDTVTPQLQLTGLISNGQASTIFIAVGRIPSDLARIQSKAKGMLGRIKFHEGKALEDEILYGAGLSEGLAKKLKLDVGSNAVVMSPTVNGQINALDIEVFQLFSAPLEELDDKLMRVGLSFARRLYDTTSVDRMTVLLKDDGGLKETAFRLEEAFRRDGLDVEVRTWEDLSPFYRKVKEMFDIIFMFIFVIVLVIVVMSVVNTVGMSIMERTREIGTLRALGLKRAGVTRLFAIESALLGVGGCCLGMALTLMSWACVAWARPTWIPPNIPRRIPLEIYLVPNYLAMSFVFLMFLAVLSALAPARKAARMPVTDALGHV